MARTAIGHSPLGTLTDALAAASGRAVRLVERAARAQLDLRADAGDPGVQQAVTEIIGVPLPRDANRVNQAAGWAALWLGPDEWLLTGPPDGEAAIEAGLRKTLGVRHGSIVDVGASRAVLGLSGARARDVLAKGCRLDLHPRAFGPDDCAQTALARAQILLHQLDDAPEYDLYVRCSFARYLASWLLDAMAEYRD